MPPEAPGEEGWIAVARVVAPRGNRGEVAAVPLSDLPGRFQELREVYLCDAGATGQQHRRFAVEEAWEHRGRIVLKLRGVETISEAERLRGCEVRIPLASRPELPAGEYYQSDLVGCELIERSSGRRVGRVKGWQQHGGPALLEVEGDGGEELLVPFARSICVEIDAPGRRVLVDLPEGLKDLNR
ncbi:MAG: ribosome maturation factor RimM [Bryobacteraceae bacterium]